MPHIHYACCPLPLSHTDTALPTCTKPSLHDRSLQFLTLSFSVQFGSAIVDYYLMRIYTADDPNINDTNYSNITNTTDLGYTLLNITSGDLRYLTQEKEIVEGEGEEEEVVGYEVRLKVRELEQGEKYVFAVAAGSTIGLGDFSHPSDPYSLKSGMYEFL